MLDLRKIVSNKDSKRERYAVSFKSKDIGTAIYRSSSSGWRFMPSPAYDRLFSFLAEDDNYIGSPESLLMILDFYMTEMSNFINES